MKIVSRLAIPLYVFGIVALFLYSYTQVDLSLTLSRLSIWQVVEKAFQYIGYFQRPLSTGIFLFILLILSFTYVCFLVLFWEKKLSQKTLWLLIFFTAILLTFSYNAFSYDLFNYIFDAKIITHYFQNPYLHRALDFPHDPMLSFMHWTQRTYPYGPVWLLVTVPLSFLGSQIFLLTFFLFKALAAVGYLITCWTIEKILQKTDPEKQSFGLAFFALSPFVLYEGLVSAHNDMTMVMFASLSVYLLLYKKSVWSFFMLILSIGVKFATAVLLPFWIFWLYFKKRDPKMEKLFLISFVALIVPVVAATIRTNFQPWYALFLFPFPALMPRRLEILTMYEVFTCVSLLQYVPFLYTGNWNPPIPAILVAMLWGGLVVSLLLGGAVWFFRVAKKQ